MRTRPPAFARPRRGLSIVEVLVALVLVAVGLLGMAGSTTLALRTTFDAQRRREAVHRVESRFASLSAAGCSHAAGGSSTDSARRLHEVWAVHSPAGGFVTISDSVHWMTAQGARSLAITSAILC